MKRKYALVLSGGGFKGAFQLGALNYLADNWKLIAPDGMPMHFDIIAGVSVGALNGALLAMRKRDQLNALWQEVARNGVEEIYTSPFIDTKANGDTPKMNLNADVLREQFLRGFEIKLRVWDGIKMFVSKKQKEKRLREILKKAAESIKDNIAGFHSIADNDPLYRKLQTHLDKDAIRECQFLCGLVSLDDGSYASVSQDSFLTNEDFVKGVLASSAMPIIWRPVESIQANGKMIRNSVDGGIRNNSPLGDVIQAIHEDEDPNVEYTIIIINCNTGNIMPEDYTRRNIFQIALRSLEEITLAEIFNNDVKHFMEINEMVRQAENQGVTLVKKATKARQTSRPLCQFQSLLINPEDGVLGDMLCANQKLVDKRMGHGHQQAKAALENFLSEQGRQAEAA